MFDFSSHQVTQLKIFTNQFAAAFRKRATTPAEIATRQAAVRAVKKEPCDRARNGRSANLCHSPLPLTAANSSAGGRKSSSSKEVVSVLIDPNELPDLTDIPTGQLLSLSLSLGVLSFESHSLSHTHGFSSLLSLSQSLSLTLSLLKVSTCLCLCFYPQICYRTLHIQSLPSTMMKKKRMLKYGRISTPTSQMNHHTSDHSISSHATTTVLTQPTILLSSTTPLYHHDLSLLLLLIQDR